MLRFGLGSAKVRIRARNVRVRVRGRHPLASLGRHGGRTLGEVFIRIGVKVRDKASTIRGLRFRLVNIGLELGGLGK